MNYRNSLKIAKHITIIMTLFASGCSSDTSSNREEQISSKTFVGTWALTVDRVTIGCVPTSKAGGELYVADSEGIKYGLNGTAENNKAVYRDLAVIWKIDPDPQYKGSGKMMDLGSFMTKARSLCKN